MTRRISLFWAVMAVAFPLLFIAGICVGRSLMISPFSLFGEASDLDSTIIKLRLMRTLTAFIVGGGLAVAGCGYQAVLRNPLAEPFILGISGGASLGAAIAIACGLAAVSAVFVPMLAFVGAIIVITAVLIMARGAGAEYTTNVMLSGVIISTVCSSVIMFLISVVGMETIHSVTWWMLGSLEPGDYVLLRIVSGTIIVCSIIMLIFAREANVLSFGEEMAGYLGVSAKTAAFLILGLASLMTAAAVAVSGIIGFVGLIIPHVLRRLLGANHRNLFPAALVSGGAFLIICDLVARNLIYPRELPVGVITAILGGPFFLWLLNKRKVKA